MDMEISITRGLTELKTLDARINKAIGEGNYIAMTVGKKSVVGFPTIEDFEKKAKSSLQSVQDLIKRRNAIKSAIVNSNATTKVTIAGQEMTVAEAIERKTSINYEKALLQKLVTDYNNTIRRFEQESSKVQERLDELLKTTYGKDVKVSSDQYDSTAKPFLEQNEPKLIDPLKLREEIEKLDKSIAEFEMNVDFVLSESNTITKITVPDSI
jgi:sugar-specific transcriptional regulator TrmB